MHRYLTIPITFTNNMTKENNNQPRKTIKKQRTKLTPRRYKCDTCKIVFPSLESFKYHFRKTISKTCFEKHEYECPCCNKIFTTRSYLHSHLYQKDKYGHFFFEMKKCKESNQNRSSRMYNKK